MIDILTGRQAQIHETGADAAMEMACDRHSLAGSVSQRACVFCGSRVVLYPICDAIHLVHGPIGCAAYTWDIRGALSSGPELHRLSFSTDLQETDVIYGGETKLYRALRELIAHYKPKAAFVYSTCIVGLIGDDVSAICRRVSEECGISVLPVECEGFEGTKKDGYKAACDCLMRIIGTGSTEGISARSINILGDFNLAGETWMIRDYYERLGVEVVATITGDGRVDAIRRAHGAALNVVQCAGSMIHLARAMEQRFGMPFLRVSYFGIEDMAKSLYDVAEHFRDEEMLGRARQLVYDETTAILPELRRYREDLAGQAGGRLCGRRLQGLFARPFASHARHQDGCGGFADR